MEKIIEGLISIENEAVLVTKEAENEKKNLPGDIKAQTETIIRHVEQETAQTIQKLYEEARLDCERKMEELVSLSRSREAALQRDFDEHHTQWETDIFNRVLGR